MKSITFDGDTWRHIIDVLHERPEPPFLYARLLSDYLWINVQYRVGPVTIILQDYDAGFVVGVAHARKNDEP